MDIQVRELNADYTHTTGIPVRRFVCPITLEDDPEAELCKGHVLNRAIKEASGVTIVQRKDVDGHFGQTIEPDLIDWLNIPVMNSEEHLRRGSRNLSLITPDGNRVGLFFADASARERFQQVDLHTPNGEVVASPFLRTNQLEPGYYSDIAVEWLVGLHKPAIIGSLLKSGYLAMFRLLGYKWATHSASAVVRERLAAFFHNRAKKVDAGDYFGDFNGAVSVIFNRDFDRASNTLSDDCFWLHIRSADHSVFAITALFNLNDYVHMVTLPFHSGDRDNYGALETYRAFIADRSLPHDILKATFSSGAFNVLAPVAHQFVTDIAAIPPEQT